MRDSLILSIALVLLILIIPVSVAGILPLPFRPYFNSASVEPLKVVPGDTMEVTAEVSDFFGIESVIADMGGVETIKLYLENGSSYHGIWKTSWLVHDTEEKEYITTVIATNNLGLSAYYKLKWSDANTLTANSSLLTTTINTGENSTLFGNCTCTDATCNDVNITIQNSIDNINWGPTSTSSSEPVYTNITTYHIGQLSSETSDDYYFNVSANTAGLYYFRVQCNSTDAEPYYANSTEETLTVNQAYGYLNVTLNQPPPASSSSIKQNKTFIVNASVKCLSSNPTAICREVNGTVRYNWSYEPDIPVNTTEGDVPFWTTENPMTCGLMNYYDNCSLEWTVNATGKIDRTWTMDVNFTSNETSITSNATSQVNITIVCPIFITLHWTLINFSSLFPGEQGAAVGNDDNIYNITVEEEGCHADLYVKGSNLTNDGSYQINVGNITWNNTNQQPGTELKGSYELVNSSIAPGVNITTYYWIDVPSVYEGNYSGTVWIKGVEPGENP